MALHRRLGLSLAALALACTSEPPAQTRGRSEPAVEPAPVAPAPVVEPVVEPAAPELPPAGAFVVIAADAPVYLAARGDARTLPSAAVNDGLDHSAKVIDVRDGFIHVETLAPSQTACAPGFALGATARLSLYVRPQALRPVLRVTETIGYDDGTRLELVPGVPVRSGDSGTHVVVGPHRFRASIDDAKLGRWFDALTPVPDLEAEGREGGYASGMPLRAGEHRFQAESGHFGHAWAGPEQLLTFVNGCGRFVVMYDDAPDANKGGLYAVDGPTLIEADPDGPSDPARMAYEMALLELIHAGKISIDDTQPPDCKPVEWLTPAATVLSWPDGSEAGVLLVEHLFDGEPEAGAAQLCFELVPGTEGGAGAGLEACVPASEVIARDNPACARQHELVGALLDGGKKPRPPQVKVGKSKVSGDADAKFIRKIVDIRVNEVRACYTPALAKQPGLAGRVEISFVIGLDGKVLTSVVEHAGVDLDAVATCIAAAPKRWTFLAPKDGAVVTVRQSFELSPG